MKIAVLIAVALTVCAMAPGLASAAETRADYVAQADPLCADANRDIAKLNRRFRALHERGRHRAAGAVLKKTGHRLSSSISQVRRIKPPPGRGAG